MAAPRLPAHNAQNVQFGGPAARGPPRPAGPAAPPAIVGTMIDNFDRSPWNLDKYGVPVTMNRVVEQFHRYTRIVNHPNVITQPNLAFPGADPELRCVELGIWVPPPELLYIQARNPEHPVPSPLANTAEPGPPMQPQQPAAIPTPTQMQNLPAAP
ncbi:hypothetical protein IFR05_001400 [Cadophora sp. M221]|nr:hypothetical protein IFR05_001400 [Cadophora sp. M221]